MFLLIVWGNGVFWWIEGIMFWLFVYLFNNFLFRLGFFSFDIWGRIIFVVGGFFVYWRKFGSIFGFFYLFDVSGIF